VCSSTVKEQKPFDMSKLSELSKRYEQAHANTCRHSKEAHNRTLTGVDVLKQQVGQQMQNQMNQQYSAMMQQAQSIASTPHTGYLQGGYLQGLNGYLGNISNALGQLPNTTTTTGPFNGPWTVGGTTTATPSYTFTLGGSSLSAEDIEDFKAMREQVKSMAAEIKKLRGELARLAPLASQQDRSVSDILRHMDSVYSA
jgi:hypothetical protein